MKSRRNQQGFLEESECGDIGAKEGEDYLASRIREIETRTRGRRGWFRLAKSARKKKGGESREG